MTERIYTPAEMREAQVRYARGAVFARQFGILLKYDAQGVDNIAALVGQGATAMEELAVQRQKVQALVTEWRAMAADAFADGAIPGDIGHDARWHGVEFCADELEARFGLTGEEPR